jgi:hypothetical protein
MSRLALLLLLVPVAAPAATPCSGDLTTYRWTHRPLVVLAADAQDPRYRAFAEAARALGPALGERDVALIHAFARTGPGDPPCTLDPRAAAGLRASLGIAAGDATVVLFGKDGGEKRRQSVEAPLEPLLELIDGMPMRQREARERTSTPPPTPGRADR